MLIADAALRVIAEVGTSGLTHRRVDAEAGLPEGSTSYYCRRRIELLTLALRRHAELNLQALGRVGDLKSVPAADFPAALATGLTAWMRSQSRGELVTRFELFLAAAHEPSLQDVISESRTRFLATLEPILKAYGIGRARSVASAILALVEGLLLERVRSDKMVVRAGDLRGWFEALFAAPPRAGHTRAPLTLSSRRGHAREEK